jgi:septum formation protein
MRLIKKQKPAFHAAVDIFKTFKQHYFNMQKIILASQSPRRKQLLEWAEIPFIAITANTAEAIPPGISIEEVPIQIALEKAMVVKEKLSRYEEGTQMPKGAPILAADTIVVLDDEIIGKPNNRAHAIEILTKLSGKTHKVITGVVIVNGETHTGFYDCTEVLFYDLTPEQIAFYVDRYEPYDKAGAYAIQEWIGVVGIKKVTGDFYNVMGLPVARVVRELEKL